ncbi:MAG: hypothetical protein R3250_16010, partial [Melioribacteraceae bacterium]|nr:hypothetical protein [Melioribacteraceae bacterium]
NGDAIRFFKQLSGQKILLGEGTFSALAGSPAEAMVNIQYRNKGNWIIEASYGNNLYSEVEVEIFDHEIIQSEGYFIIHCNYTSSRSDKFFFDDIEIHEIKPDKEAPKILHLEAINEQLVTVSFNERLNPSSSWNTDNFFIDGGIGNPLTVQPNESNPLLIELMLSKPLQSGVVYTLHIKNVSDERGNVLFGEEEFFLIESPDPLDLIVNEILFNPFPASEDFLEIFNRSNKFTDLSRLKILNTQNDRFVDLGEPKYISPGEYIVFTSYRKSLEEHYLIQKKDQIYQHDLPPFNNDQGNVSLVFREQTKDIFIDSFDYSEDMHSDFLKDVEGVSLERINQDGLTNDVKNWHSAAAVSGFATPGYENSNLLHANIKMRQRFILLNKTFSPNGDGIDDLLLLKYSLDLPGFILNAKIFDVNGRVIRNLMNNKLLALDGTLSWDGSDNDGNRADLGIYILWLELFHPDGMVHKDKISIILADYLD